jgi:geranylgeranyl reductase family protein
VIRCDALVVGGGPAGSTCARALKRAGWDVVLADRARFPRDKVCAGWLTPEVFPLLDLEPSEYRASGATLQEIVGFRTGVLGASLIETHYDRVVSYAIRRCEFDTFLVRRAGVRLLEKTAVTTLRRRAGLWTINDTIETPLLIGAGGHFCPVARHLRGADPADPPVVAKEAEFELRAGKTEAEHNPELFFCRDFEGYGWSVRKGNYLNVGIGRRTSVDFNRHVAEFVTFLERRHTVTPGSPIRWRGHAYLASGVGARRVHGDGLVLTGDAAGLAYPASGEGIKPAIESGRLAAETIIAGRGRVDAEALAPYSDAVRKRHPPAPRRSAVMRAAVAAAGRALLLSPGFTRHMVLDRWFLRTIEAP